MASFQFINNYTDQVATLDKVDEEICKDLSIDYNPDRYCPVYEGIVNIGFAILMRFGGSHVTELTYLQWRNQFDADDWFLKHETFFRKYLYGKYRFTAWR